MRVGVFTPLLSQLSLEDVLKKLTAKGISTVELGTGNYPGNAHCKLSMLGQCCRAGCIPQTDRQVWILDQRAELPWQPAAPR